MTAQILLRRHPTLSLQGKKKLVHLGRFSQIFKQVLQKETPTSPTQA